MTLNEIHQVDEGFMDVVGKLAHGMMAATLVGTLGIAGFTVKDMYDTENKIVDQLIAKNPKDAKAYIDHLEAYTENLPRKSRNLGKGQFHPAKEGNPEKAKEELKAIEDILRRNDVKK